MCIRDSLVPLLQRWYEASRELAPSLQLKGIELGDELVVQADLRALMLALDQLLDNACQHANRSMRFSSVLLGVTGATVAFWSSPVTALMLLWLRRIWNVGLLRFSGASPNGMANVWRARVWGSP